MAGQGTLLDILKKKMRSMKEELEATQESAQESLQKLQQELRRREEVSFSLFSVPIRLIIFGVTNIFGHNNRIESIRFRIERPFRFFAAKKVIHRIISNFCSIFRINENIF